MSSGNERGNPRYSLASAAVNEEKDKALLFVGMLAILNKRRCFYFAESSNQKACLWCAFDRPGRGAEIIFKHPGFHVWRAYQRYQFFCQHRHVCGHRPRAGLRCYCRALTDILCTIIRPMGAYMPLFTLTNALMGILPALFFLKQHRHTFWKTLLSVATAQLVCSFCFNTLILIMMGMPSSVAWFRSISCLFADSCAFGADLRAFKIHKEIPCSRPCPASAPAK